MKKIPLFMIAFFAALSLQAQEVISSQGQTYSSANATIDFTVGETVIETQTNGNTEITQGFHQTLWNFIGTEDHVIGFNASVFPNPTQEWLNIQSEVYGDVSYAVYDMNGKIVASNFLTSLVTTVEVSHWAQGNYSIVLSQSNQKLKTFKLIKLH
jgi:hypothetical protein